MSKKTVYLETRPAPGVFEHTTLAADPAVAAGEQLAPLDGLSKDELRGLYLLELGDAPAKNLSIKKLRAAIAAHRQETEPPASEPPADDDEPAGAGAAGEEGDTEDTEGADHAE